MIPLIQTLGDEDVQHVLVTGREALSGEWVRDVVKTGVDSWRPVHLLLMCSVTCINAALRVVGHDRNMSFLSLIVSERDLCSATGSLMVFHF